MDYEDEIYQIANDLNGRTSKEDRMYTFRVGQMLTLFDELGFGGWVVNRSYELGGVEIATEKPVRLVFNRSRAKKGKNIYVKMLNDKAEVIFIGCHDGIRKVTDLKSMDTYYDEAVWSYRLYQGQVRLNSMGNGGDTTTQMEQMAIAIKEMEGLGIVGCKHLQMLTTTEGWNADDYAKMVPALVGMYGELKVLLKLSQYGNQMDIDFYMFPAVEDKKEEIWFGKVYVKGGEVVEREVDMKNILGGNL